MATIDPHEGKFIEDTVSKAEPVEKVDSGMEEDNSGNMMQGDSSDDDDGEIIVKKQGTKSKKRHILDDDSDESDTETTKPKPQTFTAEQVLEAVMADSSDNNQDDTDLTLTSTTASAKKRKIKRPVADDSSSDEEDVHNEETTASLVDEDAASKKKEDVVSQTDEVDEVSMNDDVPSSSRRPDNEADSADSDSSDSRSSSGSDNENSDRENQDKDNADEGFNEDALDPKLLAKLKKGAAKTPRDKSARISKNEGMMSIHSESQRIVREGRVNLPYHQPAPKSLNDFLARASKKRQEYQSLRGGVRDSRKAKAIEGVLQSSRLQVKQKTQEELDKYSDSDEDWDANKEAEKSLRERVTDRLKDLDKSADKVEDEPRSKESAENSGSIIKCSANDGNKNDDTDDDKDTLPDLIMESESVNCVSKDGSDSTVLKCDSSSENDKMDNNISDTIDKTEEENDTGDLLYEWEKSETCKIDSDIDTKQNHNENDIASVDKENICDDDILKSSEKDPENISPDKKSSPKTKSDKKLKKERMLALAGIDLNINQPRLTGETETFISLVEEEAAPQHPGLVKLMNRLTKHTAKKEKKHSKDLDISIVSKDKVGMNKEELKLNTFTYHMEEEDSNPLLKLETPGAKLLALKEQLQEKIKEKREAARQKRQELYNLDNEEGDFGAEEEEMSEHSDTDVDDDEFEEQYGGDEEEDALDEEENKRERNPFAEEQAEDDGLEDEEEDGLDNEEEEELEDEEDDGADADDEDEMNLKLDVSDEEEETEPELTRIKKTIKRKKQKCNDDEGDDTSDTAEFKDTSDYTRMLAPHEEQKAMPLPIIYMLTQVITHLIPIPLKTAIRRLRKMGIGQFRVKDVLVVMSTEETELPFTTYLFQTLPLNLGAISLVTVKERNVYCGISGSVAKVTCENLTYQVLNVLIPYISVRQTPYKQLIIHFSEKERLGTNAHTVMSTETNTAIIEIFRKNIKSELNLISTLIHELDHFFSSFNAKHDDEWYSNVCYLAAILHETHKQYLGRILPILDTTLTIAKYRG